MSGICYILFKIAFWLYFKLYTGYTINNASRIPKTGGVLMVSNHISYLDPLVVGTGIPRRATFLAKEELFDNSPVGWFVTAFSFPIRRDNPQPSTIKEAVRRLKKGELIVMFPQGTRSKTLDDDIELKRGVTLIARLGGAPIVPVFVKGTEKALPQGRKFPLPHRITVSYGTPIEVTGLTDEQISSRVVSALNDLREGKI